jgi:NAD(P)H-flavin reductase
VRFDRVIAPFGAREVQVSERPAHGVYVVLCCEDPAGPRPAPGQFYMLSAARYWGGGAGERPFLPRALSVMRAPAETVELQFLLEDVGPGTERLCQLVKGDGLRLLGPLGAGFRPPRDGRHPVLIGGGVGIAPLVILSDALDTEDGSFDRDLAGGGLAGPPPATLLGFRDADHAVGAELLPGARVATDDGSIGHYGPVTDLLLDELHLDPDAEVYACGPPPMLEAVRIICAERELPLQLALEAGMACGFGACFGCTVETTEGYRRVCIDGPVFEGASLPAVAG